VSNDRQHRPAGARRLIALAALLSIGLATSVAPAAKAGAMGDTAQWQTVRIHVEHVDAAGTTFAFARIGSGSPVVMLNGTGSPMSEWDPALLSALAERHLVIVLDYPGLGLSGPAPARWRFDRAADWIAAFVSTVLPGQPMDVVGWSMGGFIAQQLAARHPGVVRRLVLAGTNPGGDQAVLGPIWVQEADSAPDAGDTTYLRTNYPDDREAQDAGRRFLHRLESAVDTGAYPIESTPARTFNAMVAAEDPWVRSNANVSALRSIVARTLVITGDDDVITPPVNSRRIAREIAGARLLLVPGAGHSFLFQRPRAVGRAIAAFLDAG
jgi:pimeloyl-ACP methyl ester carboxylesterase